MLTHEEARDKLAELIGRPPRIEGGVRCGWIYPDGVRIQHPVPTSTDALIWMVRDARWRIQDLQYNGKDWRIAGGPVGGGPPGILCVRGEGALPAHAITLLLIAIHEKRGAPQ